jgi:hypothetical protein
VRFASRTRGLRIRNGELWRKNALLKTFHIQFDGFLFVFDGLLTIWVSLSSDLEGLSH